LVSQLQQGFLQREIDVTTALRIDIPGLSVSTRKGAEMTLIV